jgi:hypothetical protein
VYSALSSNPLPKAKIALLPFDGIRDGDDLNSNNGDGDKVSQLAIKVKLLPFIAPTYGIISL